jgi:hypothetical protein
MATTPKNNTVQESLPQVPALASIAKVKEKNIAEARTKLTSLIYDGYANPEQLAEILTLLELPQVPVVQSIESTPT